MPAWLLVALTIGAVTRLTRLVTADYITKPIRDRLVDRWGEDAKRSYLITCDYCASMYVAFPVAFAVVWWPTNRGILIALIALTASLIAGILGKHDAS
jgi:hypothetical protein